MSEPYRFGGPIPESVQRLKARRECRAPKAGVLCGFPTIKVSPDGFVKGFGLLQSGSPLVLSVRGASPE